MAKQPKPTGEQFAYTEGSNLDVETELTGAAAEEYAALEKLWAAQAELEEAEAELAELDEGDDE